MAALRVPARRARRCGMAAAARAGKGRGMASTQEDPRGRGQARREGMRIRIAVVDDFELMRAGVIAALRREPAVEVVGQAGDGEEALRLARELEPDVMLLDLNMPHLGGMQVLEGLR